MLQTLPSHLNSAPLIEMFEPYELCKEEMDRFKSRCLGQASLRIGSHMFSSCAFFEIVSENSDGHQSEEEILESPIGLPPKKRKRSTTSLIKSSRSIVFSVKEGLTELSLSHPVYLLPRHAVTECLTSTAPHQMVFSFFPSTWSKCDCRLTTDDNGFKTALEELAAVCSHSCKLSGDGKGHVTNAMLFNVSFELYRAIKQMVFHYEQMCQNMMALMTLHHQQVSHHKSEMMVYMTQKNPSEPSSQPMDHLKDAMDPAAEQVEATPSIVVVEQEETKTMVTKPRSSTKKSTPPSLSARSTPPQTNPIKKCLYCGSKSTPMWRRGPQGAGTLCNACGVKWKHGKILNGHPDDYISPHPHETPLPPRRATKQDKKRKKSITAHRRVTKKKVEQSQPEQGEEAEDEQEEEEDEEEEEEEEEEVIEAYFAVPTTTPSHIPQVWEGQSTSSSTSDSYSPLESFTPSLLVEQKQSEMRRDISDLMSYDTETLSVYVGEDAVEAAAVLTLLKRS